jgi:hypothetical protein
MSTRAHLRLAWILAATLAAAGALGFAAAAPAGGAARPRTIRLFNGKDLSAFYTFLRDKGRDSDPDGVFKVDEGQIHVSGREFGYIATRDEFDNYRLVVEYRWGERTFAPRETRARDSGILFHMQGADKVWPASIELNIIEGGTGDLILVGDTSVDFAEALRPRLARPDVLSPDGKRIVKGRVNVPGRSPEWKDVLGFRGSRDLEKPVGQWNRAEVISLDGAIKFVVNGRTALEATGARPSRGRILLQSEGAEIFFRRIDLTPLAPTTAEVRR